MGNLIYRVFLFKVGKQTRENSNVYCKILQIKKMRLKVEIWLRSLDIWFDQSFSNWSEVSIIVGNKKVCRLEWAVGNFEIFEILQVKG